MTAENNYQLLRDWYLSRLRRTALETKTSVADLTPAALISIDREIINQMVQERATLSPPQPAVKKAFHYSVSLRAQITCAVLVTFAIQVLALLGVMTVLAQNQNALPTDLAKLPQIIGIIIGFSIGAIFLALYFIEKTLFRPFDSIFRQQLRYKRSDVYFDESSQIAVLDKASTLNVDELEQIVQREWLIADYALDLIFMLNEDGLITAISPSCFRQLGYTPESLQEQSIYAFIPKDKGEQLRASLLQRRMPGTSSQMDLDITHKSGDLRCFRVIFEWSENSRKYFCTGVDVTLETSLERAKDDFVAMISHDLRAPLSSLASYFDVLNSGSYGPLTEKGKHMTRLAHDNLTRLSNLTSDLLDLDMLEGGQLHLQMNEVSVDDLIENSIQTVECFADQFNIAFVYNDNPRLKVAADFDRLSQVLVNLLYNAVKFSPPESTVEVAAEVVQGCLEIKVIDEGRGIAIEEQSLIFERYKQTSSEQKQKKGRGLGLAIVKGLVQLHGGTVGVESEIEKGSTFWFKIPNGSLLS